MDRSLRALFNQAYDPETYAAYQRRMRESLAGEPIPFRLAETPVFLDPDLRARCEVASREILALMKRPDLIARCAARIPPALDVPGAPPLPHSVVIDFGLVQGEGGRFEPRLIECQGFNSLYGFQTLMGDVWEQTLAEMPGLPPRWSVYFGGHDRDSFRELLRATILGGCDPEEVVLLDIHPRAQKTRPDFVATTALLGIREVCLTDVVKRGERLYAPRGSELVPVRRIYNRVIFDELITSGVRAPFSYTEPLDVTWVSHPNWFLIWSKATLPLLDHPAVPESWFLSDLPEWPADLSRYVLKPLYSFAGHGVEVDVSRERLDAVPPAQRGDWLLMEKVDYARGLVAPDGAGVKVELRILFLRPDESAELVPAINLCRLSRGKMHGVDHNRDLDWVGSSVAIWPA